MYGKQLARIHDNWFSDLSKNAAELITTGLPNLTGPMVDFGCGSGTLLAKFNGMITKGYGSIFLKK